MAKIVLGVQGLAPDKAQENAGVISCVALRGIFVENSVVSPFVCFSAQTLGVKVDSIGKDYAASATALEIKPIKKKPNPKTTLRAVI